MADTPTPTPETPAAPPAIDLEAVKAATNAALVEALPGALQSAISALPPPPAQPQYQQPRERDPMADIVGPYIAPAANAALIGAASAVDATNFYTSGKGDERDLKEEWRDDIEKQHQDSLRHGNPRPRGDIFKMLKGERFETLHNARVKRNQDEALKAQQMLTVGPSSPAAPRAPGGDNPYTMPREELDKALTGFEF